MNFQEMESVLNNVNTAENGLFHILQKNSIAQELQTERPAKQLHTTKEEKNAVPHQYKANITALERRL